MRRVTIRFFDAERSTVSRILNFGEDLWRALRKEKSVDIDLGAIDRARDLLTFSVRKRCARRAMATTKHMLRLHMMENEAEVAVDDGGDER